MHKTIARGLFYGVATVLILWTATLTYSFVSTALPQTHWLVPLFALVIFDVGMLAWLKVFLDYAEGSGQRALALILSLFDFLGVGLMVLAEILLGGQTMVAPPENLGEYAIWGIAIWTVVNVGGVLIFHMLQPDARRKMVLQSEMDMVFDEALKKLSTRRAAIGGELSDRLADGLLAQLVAGLALEGNRPALEATIPAAEAKPLPVSENHRGGDFLA
jgi:signal transduction histidine kinase